MSLFTDIVTISLTAEITKYGNNITFQLGDKQGELSKDSSGYSFKINNTEKYFFTFNRNVIPNNYTGVFYVNTNNINQDIIAYLVRCKKICLYFQFPYPNAIITTWGNNFFYKEEAIKEGIKGLRPPQRGALHSILAHWSISTDPAIIVMPTGTGKTETMLSLVVAKKLSKVLVIVPSDSLRTQIAKKL